MGRTRPAPLLERGHALFGALDGSVRRAPGRGFRARSIRLEQTIPEVVFPMKGQTFRRRRLVKKVLITSMLAIGVGCGAALAQEQQPAQSQSGADCPAGSAGCPEGAMGEQGKTGATTKQQAQGKAKMQTDEQAQGKAGVTTEQQTKARLAPQPSNRRRTRPRPRPSSRPRARPAPPPSSRLRALLSHRIRRRPARSAM